MFCAVYYPHTAVRDEKFLKHSLLYWDEIEYISPFDGYDALPRYENSVMRELALIMKPRVPTEGEKKKAHGQIMKLLDGDLPSWLRVDRIANKEEHALFSMFREKLLPDTWDELRRRKMVSRWRSGTRAAGGFDDYASHTYLGLTLMAILARCCAGGVKHTITDRSDSYYALLKHLQYLSGEDEIGKSPIDHASQNTFKRWLDALGIEGSSAEDKARETLVSITLDVIDTETISVENLLHLRDDKTGLAADLRQNYARAVETYVDRLSAPDLTETDVKALADDFKRTMELDLHRLCNDLKLTAGKTLLLRRSREMTHVC